MINRNIFNLLEILEAFSKHQSAHRILNKELVKNGWYPNSIVFRHTKYTYESIDDFMMRCLMGDYYEQIKTEYFYNSYPHRRKIYEEAFKLFEEERYLAAIPLFLSQLDGIISENGLSGIFQGNKNLNNDPKPENLIFFEYLNYHNQSYAGKSLIKYHQNIIDHRCELSISKGTSQISNPDEIGHLNRHGILHGHKNYLNYGCKINTLKVISLTLFIINTITVMKIENTQVQE